VLKLLDKLVQLWFVYERQMLIGLFILALGLRLGTLIYLGVPYPVYEDLMEPGQIVQNLIRDAGYTFDFYGYRAEAPLQAFVPPLYPLLVYIVLRWASEPAVTLGLAQALIGGLMAVLMYLLIRELANRSTALLSASLTAIYPVFLVQAARPLPTTLVGCLITAVMTTTVFLRHRGYGCSLALGLALGLAALARTTMLGLIPIVILWLRLNRRDVSTPWRKLGIALVVAALVISPWLIRNYCVFGKWVFSTNAGITFWNGNNPFTTGSGWDVYIERLRQYSGHPFPNYPAHGIVTPRPYPLPKELETQVGQLDELELDRRLFQAGIAFIQTQPRLWLSLTVQKLVSFWLFRPNIGAVRYLYDPKWVLPYQVLYSLLLPLAAIGIILSFKQWRMYSLLYTCFAYFVGVYVAFNVVTRYRFEIEQFLLFFASLAVTQGIGRRAGS
jgi:4-amino-4-deoxy-L-arabinose transferase-like glycosyltransferase